MFQNCEIKVNVLENNLSLLQIARGTNIFFVCTLDEIDLQHDETADIERNIRNMHNDMLKLNMLLHKEKGTQHNLQQGNILMENDFIGSLKVNILMENDFIGSLKVNILMENDFIGSLKVNNEKPVCGWTVL